MNQAVLEGLLFVVGDEGITLEAIMDIMKVSETEAKSLLNELKNVKQEIKNRIVKTGA